MPKKSKLSKAKRSKLSKRSKSKAKTKPKQSIRGIGKKIHVNHFQGKYYINHKGEKVFVK